METLYINKKCIKSFSVIVIESIGLVCIHWWLWVVVIPQLNASAVPDHKGVISYICGHMCQQPHMLASLPYCQRVHKAYQNYGTEF